MPQESIKIGDVFDQVQARKDEVDLVDYSIAQPSLEAVFISAQIKCAFVPYLLAVDATASPLSPLRLGGQNVALGPLEGFPSPPLGGQTLALWSS